MNKHPRSYQVESILHRMVFLVLVAFSAPGCSGADDPTGDREGNFPIINSGHWVAATGGGPSGTIFWLDDNRVVFTGYDPNNIEEVEQQPPGSKLWKQRIFVWDVDKNEVTPYKELKRGGLTSVHDGIIKYFQMVDGKHLWWRGPFGQETSSWEQPYKPNRLFHLRGREENREGMPLSRGKIYYPLRVEHGYIDRGPSTGTDAIRKITPDEFQLHPLTLYPAIDKPGIPLIRPPNQQGERVPLMGKDIDSIQISYAKFADFYVAWSNFIVLVAHPDKPGRTMIRMNYGSSNWREKTPATPIYTIKPDGEVGEVQAPFREWVSATYLIEQTKKGLLMMSRDINTRRCNDFGDAGLYLLEEDHYVKVVAGYVLGVKVSPNGCRVAVAVGDYKSKGSFAKVIELCKGEK